MVSLIKSLVSYDLNKVDEVPNTTLPTQEESLAEFRTALNAVPGLHVSSDNGYLLRFLRAKGFKIADAVKLYKSTDGWKEKNASILNIPFSSCLPAFKSGIFTILKEKDGEGRTILYFKADNWNVSEVPIEMAMKSAYNVVEESQTTEENQLNGLVIIVDIANRSVARTIENIAQFTLKNIKLLIGFVQGGSPVKVKAVYAVNTPLLAVTTYTAVKYLLKRKMRNRIHIHYDGIDSIHKYIDPQRLPQFLGGHIPDQSAEDTQLMNSLFFKNQLIYSSSSSFCSQSMEII